MVYTNLLRMEVRGPIILKKKHNIIGIRALEKIPRNEAHWLKDEGMKGWKKTDYPVCNRTHALTHRRPGRNHTAPSVWHQVGHQNTSTMLLKVILFTKVGWPLQLFKTLIVSVHCSGRKDYWFLLAPSQALGPRKWNQFVTQVWCAWLSISFNHYILNM